MGKPTGSDLTHKPVHHYLIQLNYLNHMVLTPMLVVEQMLKKDILKLCNQSYDLQSLWADVSESGKRIDITRVFHEGTPTITRFFDPYSVSGQGTLNLVDEFGFGSFSPHQTIHVKYSYLKIYKDSNI